MIDAPGEAKRSVLADFTREMDGVLVAGIVTVDVAVTVVPDGPVPEALPMLVTLPLSTSAWVVV